MPLVANPILRVGLRAVGARDPRRTDDEVCRTIVGGPQGDEFCAVPAGWA